MGFFKSIGNAVKTIAPVVAGGALNPALGTLLGVSTAKKALSGDDSTPSLPETSKPYREAVQRQNTKAQEFAQNVDQYKDDQFNVAAQPGRMELAKTMRGTNNQMNRRGLLYSGFNQAAQADNVSNLANQEADLRKEINTNADQLSRDQLFEALQNSLALQDMEQGRVNSNYANDLSRAQAEQAGYGNLLGLLGSLGGAAIGSQRKS